MKNMNASATAGYNKAMELMHYDTYMYDSSRRIYELAQLDPTYANADNDYRGGFAGAVYEMHRC